MFIAFAKMVVLLRLIGWSPEKLNQPPAIQWRLIMYSVVFV